MNPPLLTILGGGPAGLAVAYFARKRGMKFQLFEAADHVGGNAATYSVGDFKFDAGAHRVHDRDPEATEILRDLLGSDLREVFAPNLIYEGGRFIDFPISPLGLMGHLGVYDFLSSALDTCISRFGGRDVGPDFESYARYRYGTKVAERFLLNYSEKLWGVPCANLSSSVAGARLKGLSLRAFLLESMLRQRRKTVHLEGAHFFYPRGGFGTISERLADSAGRESIQLNSRVTNIEFLKSGHTKIEINGSRIVLAGTVVNTLPLPVVVRMMRPIPPAEIIELSEGLGFRSLVLVGLFLNLKSVTNAATVYFPEGKYPFSRIYEPKNRSEEMSPPGKTSLLAELPCAAGDSIWKASDENLIKKVACALSEIGWIHHEQITASVVRRIPFAYPVLELGYEEKVTKIFSHFGQFPNFHTLGRNGKFAYSWLHDMIRWGSDLVSELKQR